MDSEWCELSDLSGPSCKPQGGWGWGPAPEASLGTDPGSREASLGFGIVRAERRERAVVRAAGRLGLGPRARGEPGN